MCSVEILAPTFFEYLAARCVLPHARVRWVGMRLTRWRGTHQGSTVVVCGLAGALAPGLPPGTILIPEQVGLVDGEVIQCDATLVQGLVTAARALHYQPDTRPLLTAPSLIVGKERADWYRRGFV